MRRAFIILLLLVSVIPSFGQMYFDLVTRYMIDTSNLFQKVRIGITNNNEFNQESNYLIYPIYRFKDTRPHSKDDYINGVFLNSLITVNKTDNFSRKNAGPEESRCLPICERILIASHDGEFMGHADTYFFRCFYKCQCDNKVMINRDAPLSDLLYNHVYDYLFATTQYYSKDSIRVYYGINKKKKQVDVVFHTKYGIKIISIEEVVNNHWEDFYQGSPKLKNEIYNDLKHSFDSIMDGIPHDFCYF